MRLISFVHIRDKNNTGDMASCPALWFDFDSVRLNAEVLDYTEQPRGSVIIYGGGTMVNWLHQAPPLPNAKKILWGAGSSRHGEVDPWPDPDGFDLIGTREWTPERVEAGLWAPCPSCMSTMFDKKYEITRDAVAFVNASESIRGRYPSAYKTGLPTMDNSWPMEDIIPFLGSAETVVTNSYHGMAWASWLDRRVEVHDYSSKFHFFNPSLTHSRVATVCFYERVKCKI